jgi:hypothetical protein
MYFGLSQLFIYLFVSIYMYSYRVFVGLFTTLL